MLKRPSYSKIVRERRRLKAFRRMYNKGQMTENDIYNCYQSWRGSVIREHNACRNIVASMDALFQSLFPVHQEREKPSRKRMVKAINHDDETADLKYCLTLK